MFLLALDMLLPCRGKKNACFIRNGIRYVFDILLGDDKSQYLAVVVENEISAVKDPYMYIGRMYDLLRQSSSRPVLLGHPMFLITLIGPRLTIYGAFYDGSSTAVEPLFVQYLLRDPALIMARAFTKAFMPWLMQSWTSKVVLIALNRCQDLFQAVLLSIRNLSQPHLVPRDLVFDISDPFSDSPLPSSKRSIRMVRQF
ncbi:hypothetical protein GALMADRAFT_724817 [Galerina marginata CBS 339.88]|uniref:Uncharacterized protein n=1 Tax=Galerina marginata (strain CBS 339.88) TaxID=685588 RepID=A0A067SZU1_GALM3|nr:hypothetical protein GALMADRAFT_724817 [Galerina marginata CBS 339.88]